jgi:hypothetical protein
MSTNNFKFENILVVLPDFTYDEGQEFDTFAFDEYVGEIQDELEKIGFDSCDKYESGRDGGQIIAEYGLQDESGMIKYLQVVVRSGYYSGQNIDYTFDGEFDDEYNNEKNNATMDRKVKQLEKILRKNGTEMLKVAQFSSGEAVYILK